MSNLGMVNFYCAMQLRKNDSYKIFFQFIRKKMIVSHKRTFMIVSYILVPFFQPAFWILVPFPATIKITLNKCSGMLISLSNFKRKKNSSQFTVIYASSADTKNVQFSDSDMPRSPRMLCCAIRSRSRQRARTTSNRIRLTNVTSNSVGTRFASPSHSPWEILLNSPRIANNLSFNESIDFDEVD